MSPGTRTRIGESGFTLAELAIVLLIVAVLLGGLLMPLAAQIDARNIGDTEKILGEIREALIGYAARHTDPHLPCPDTDDDGLEDRSGSNCGANEGHVPWATLGVGSQDAWNNRYRYRVSPTFSNNSTGFTLSDNGNIDVCTDETCSARVADDVPAVVVSYGKNGFGAFRVTGGTNPAPDPGAKDELENLDDDNNFVSRTPGPDFDDIIVWLSPNILFSRMISAGRLP